MSALIENRLRDFRKEAHLAQEDLAARTGIRIATISRLENARHRPRLSTARALARVLTQALGRAVAIDDIFPPEVEERAS